MNATAIESQPKPQPAGVPQGAARVSYGACPNCNRTLHVAAMECPQCGAIFDEWAIWKVQPDPQRIPDAQAASSAQSPRLRGRSDTAKHPHWQPAQSLAAQILATRGSVTLEEQRPDFSPALTVMQGLYAWGWVNFLVVYVFGTHAGLDTYTFFLWWLWLTPVAVGWLYHLEYAHACKEEGLRHVRIHLAAQALSMERWPVGETQSDFRRVPFADLRLAAHLDASDTGQRLTVDLLVPADLGWPAESLTLGHVGPESMRSAAEIFDALLLHTGIAPMPNPPDVCDAVLTVRTTGAST